MDKTYYNQSEVSVPNYTKFSKNLLEKGYYQKQGLVNPGNSVGSLFVFSLIIIIFQRR